MIKKEDSLEYHSGKRPGKIEIKSSKPCITPQEMRMAYMPGAIFPAIEIRNDPANVYKYTNKSNLVAVISNGSAVPGLGDAGAFAAKPMQEGIAVLLKRLADIDVFDLEIDSGSPEEITKTIQSIAPSFGAINLKDIKAPDGLEIYDRLKDNLSIPIFHENLYSTAVGVTAALINALEIVNKKPSGIKIVLSGAGTVAAGIFRMLCRLGISPEQILVFDKSGILHKKREELADYQKIMASSDNKTLFAEAFSGADVFIGASAGNLVNEEMLQKMNRFPIVFALATPEPEISYERARDCRHDLIAATSLGQNPNSVLDILSFPYILRGALDVQAKEISEGMLMAASDVLAGLAREEVIEEVERAYGNIHLSFGPEYLLPKPIDPRILTKMASAVAQKAIEEGLSETAFNPQQYQETLKVRTGGGKEAMREIIFRSPHQKQKMVFSNGSNETILRACRIILDEKIARPVLVGSESSIKNLAESLNLDISGIQIEDPAHSVHYKFYSEEYLKLRQRKGIIRQIAETRLKQNDYYAAMMLHCGDADIMFGGISGNYPDMLRIIIEIIGPAQGIKRISSHHLVLLPKDTVLLSDCAVNVNPTAEELAENAILTAKMAKVLGIEPRAALLSYSNFGSIKDPEVKKISKALEIIRKANPELMIDGEMQLSTARDESIRNEYFPFSSLKGNANVLIFPDLQSGLMTMQSLHFLGECIAIGPILTGTRLPAHLIHYRASVDEIVNLASIASVEASAGK